jgi:PST family polysaccharide transporter
MSHGNDQRPSDLRGSTASGVRWLGGAKLLQAFLQWLFQVALARLLFPEDFGLIAAALIISGLMALLADLGVEPALVQLPDLKPHHLVAGRRLSLIIALLLFPLGTAAGFPLAAALGMPTLRTLVPLMCAGILLTPLAVVPRGLLLREMSFRPLAAAETSGILAGGLVSVGLALAGGGVWSLAVGALVNPAVNTAMVRTLRPWKAPAGCLPTAAQARRVRGFGLVVTGTAAVNYSQTQMDRLAIGANLGQAPLGHYTLGFNLMALPTRHLAMILSRIALPAVASLQKEPARLRRGYAALTRHIGLLAFPSMAGLILVAPEFIRVVYGEKWAPAILPLQILCASGWVRALCNPAGSVLHGLGRPGLNLALNALFLVLVACGAFLAAPYGIVAVAAGVTAAFLLVFPVVQWAILRQIGMGAGEYLRALLPSLAACAAMAAAVSLLRALLGQAVPMAARLLLLIACGVAAYLGWLALFHRHVFAEGIGMLRARAGGGPDRDRLSPPSS